MDGLTGMHEEDDGAIRRNFVQGTQVLGLTCTGPCNELDNIYYMRRCRDEKSRMHPPQKKKTLKWCIWRIIQSVSLICQSVIKLLCRVFLSGKYVFCRRGDDHCGPGRYLSSHLCWSYSHCCLDRSQVSCILWFFLDASVWLVLTMKNIPILLATIVLLWFLIVLWSVKILFSK